MRFWRKRWAIRWAAVAFAAAAFAPAAQASVYLDDGGGSVPAQPAPQPISAPSTTDFSWADAGVGAAAAFSIVLLATGGVMVARGTRHAGLAGAHSA
jgi:hypothetical protein